MSMRNPLKEDAVIETLLRPETELEQIILKNDTFRKGLLWGKPRFGHPEGQVALHIREVLDNVDKLNISAEDRNRLRLITFAHDTFKYKEDKTSHPRDWSKHHGVLARKFMEAYTKDDSILEILELHDEAYYCWRLEYIYRRKEDGQERLSTLLARLKNYLQLYYLFFKCDTRTGDKNQAPLKWFEKTIKNIEVVHF